MPYNSRLNINFSLLSTVITLLYIIEYHYAYTTFTIGVYEYMGLTHRDISSGDTILMYIISLLPIYWYKGFKFISSALSIFVYIFIYIPFIETLFTAILPLEIRISYGCVIFLLMILFFGTDKISLFSKLFKKRRHVLSFKYLWCLFLILLVIVLISNIGNLKFVNIFTQQDLMYELRGEIHDSRSGIIPYLIPWLGRAFIPILIVYYYIKKSKIILSLVLASGVLIFMVDMQKSTFLYPLVMIFLLYLNSKYKAIFRKYFHLALMISMMVPSFILCRYYEKNQNPIIVGISTMIIYRTQCIAGTQLDRYLNFFEVQNNPYTYYSHIGLINNITHSYPYGDNSIGQAVAGDGTNSNAAFILMDGVAAWGIIGMIVSGIMFIIFKSALNSINYRYDRTYIIIILLYGIISLINTSLFTCLLSYGLIILYILLLKFKIPLLENAEESGKKLTSLR